MKRTTEKRIEKTLDEYEKEFLETLTKNAAAAHIAGDLKAQKDLHMDVSFRLVSTEAMKYAREYKKLLVNEGASIIQGEKIAWLRDSNTETRNTIFDIIERGITGGKPTGIKEYKRGGYPKGSIADELQEFFQQRRSHAATVARTEVARIQNQGTLNRFEKQRVSKVKVLDAEGENSCQECADANGQIWDMEYAKSHELEHPDCVRVFVPIIEEI